MSFLSHCSTCIHISKLLCVQDLICWFYYMCMPLYFLTSHIMVWLLLQLFTQKYTCSFFLWLLFRLNIPKPSSTGCSPKHQEQNLTFSDSAGDSLSLFSGTLHDLFESFLYTSVNVPVTLCFTSNRENDHYKEMDFAESYW